MNLKNTALASVVSSAVLLAGCGGGGGGTGASSNVRGKAAVAVTVTWPAVNRLIPNATNAIEVTLTDGTTTIHHWTTRPVNDSSVNPTTSTVSFTDLAEGSWTATADAYPGKNNNGTPADDTDDIGTGTKQATGTAPVQIVAGPTPTPFSVTMASTVNKYRVNVNGTVYFLTYNSSGGTDVTNIGGTPVSGPSIKTDTAVSVSATPADSANGLVLVYTGATNPEVTFTPTAEFKVISASTSTSNSSTTALLAPIATGSAKLTFNYREAGKSFTLPIALSDVSFTAQGTQNYGGTIVGASDVSARGGVVGGFVNDGTTEFFVPYSAGSFSISPLTISPNATSILSSRFAGSYVGDPSGTLLERFSLGSAGTPAWQQAYSHHYDLDISSTGDPVVLFDFGSTSWTYLVDQVTGNISPLAQINQLGTPSSFAVGTGPDNSNVYYTVANGVPVQRFTSTGAADSTYTSITQSATDISTAGLYTYVLDPTAGKIFVTRWDGSKVTELTASGTLQHVSADVSSGTHTVIISTSSQLAAYTGS